MVATMMPDMSIATAAQINAAVKGKLQIDPSVVPPEVWAEWLREGARMLPLTSYALFQLESMRQILTYETQHGVYRRVPNGRVFGTALVAAGVSGNLFLECTDNADFPRVYEEAPRRELTFEQRKGGEEALLDIPTVNVLLAYNYEFVRIDTIWAPQQRFDDVDRLMEFWYQPRTATAVVLDDSALGQLAAANNGTLGLQTLWKFGRVMSLVKDVLANESERARVAEETLDCMRSRLGQAV
jgi:hypothetical protein